jgi:hypothetical protein
MDHVEQIRSRLASTRFPDLAAMMEGYARAAVERARLDYALRLDYSAESIDALDDAVTRASDTPEMNLDFEVRLWGSYLGELLRRRYAGLWEMTQYPGGLAAVPAIEVRGSKLFPLMKIFRRLTDSNEDDLRSFYEMVTGRLGSPARVN